MYLHTHNFILLVYRTLNIAVHFLALFVFFGAITAHKFNSISVVRMCERSRGMKRDDSTMSSDDSVNNKHDIFRLTCLNGVKYYDRK